LLFLRQINSSKFLFSLNEKLIINLGIGRKDFGYLGLHGITIKREELFEPGKSWISLFCMEADKEWMKTVTGIHKKYLPGAGRKKQMFYLRFWQVCWLVIF